MRQPQRALRLLVPEQNISRVLGEVMPRAVYGSHFGAIVVREVWWISGWFGGFTSLGVWER